MRKKVITKNVISLVLTIVMLIGVTACTSNTSTKGNSERKNALSIREENQTKKNTIQDIEKQSIQTSKKNTQYPLTITTYGSNGAELKTIYKKAPEKVITVYQGSIETMLALGLEKHLIAMAGLDNEVSDEQKSAFSKVNYLDEFAPSLETVTMLEPDMIFSWGSLFGEKKLGDVKYWLDKDINIYMNTNTRPIYNKIKFNQTLDNEYNDILNIGKIFDVQDKSEKIVKDMKDTITKVSKKTTDIKEKPTALILESSKDSFINYGATSLGGDMITKLGATLTNPNSLKVGKEDIVVANPDIIFVVYMPYSGDNSEKVKQENLDIILKDEAYTSLNAVKNGRVIPILLSEMFASATRTKDGIITFAKGLYPEIDLELEE